VKHFILYISIFFLFSCSTSKDNFVNRQYHALITKYNVLYNGKLAFEKGLEQVENTYQDNFSEVLPIEPFSFYAGQEINDDSEPIGQLNFQRAEEKAVKAIQKHSMLIGGEERNPQTDEAYLLMAKSRYYTKRFGPALEAFEYIIKNYPRASLIYETVVWRAKTNIHIDNVEFGKKALKQLLKSPNLTAKLRQEAEIGLVMAYQKTPDSLDLVAKHLEASLEAFSKGFKASRAAFVLGQVYQKKGMILDSDKAFDKVVGMKNGVYKLKVNAQLEKINNHIDEYYTKEFLEKVNHLIKATKNRKYLGQLLYEKALIYHAADSMVLAKKYFTESAHSLRSNVNQKVLSYEKLGDLSYDLKKYVEAKSYYDSLVDISTNKKSRRYIKIKRKSNSLSKIVSTLKSATENDSLLKIAAMKKDDLELFFQNHINKIKEQEKQARLKELRLLAAQNKSVGGFQNKNDWYFYNAMQRVNGKEEFKKLWKTNYKQLNWFAQSLNRNKIRKEVKVNSDVDNVDVKKDVDIHSLAYYTNSINRKPQFLDSITQSRNLNYYELGNAYYSQLSEKELAINQLDKLLAFNPTNDLKIGTYYKLYKIYSEEKNTNKSSYYKNKLEQEFPNSTFTKLVNNQNTYPIKESVEDYVACYEAIYTLYKNDEIDQAEEEMKFATETYTDTPLAAKFLLLNAYIVAKQKGEDAFKKLLKNLKLRHPNTEEAIKATALLKSKLTPSKDQ